MELCELNPFLRFAAQMRYETAYNATPVQVSDCRMFFVLEGTGRLSIASQQYELTPNSLFYCCAGSRYTIHTEEALRLIILNFDLSRSHSHQSLPISPKADPAGWDTMPIFLDPVSDSSFLGSHLFLENVGELATRLSAIVEEHNAGRFSDALTGAELKALLIRLHHRVPGQLPQKVVLVQEYIAGHYAQPLTNRHLAQLVGYHEYYLNRIFTAATGQSLHGYLLKVRLNRATHLILNTDLELQTIGEQVGFGSYPHFSAAFKAATGLSPARYRKHLRRNI